MRFAVLLPPACLLAACSNMVVADAPRFAPSRASTSFVLKEGVWLTASTDCPVDETRPVAEWPECVDWFVVLGGVQRRPADLAAEGSVETEHELRDRHRVIVDGDPLIMETSDCPQSGRAEAGAKQRLGGPAVRAIRFCYSGIRITGVDASGAVTGYAQWPVICGRRQFKGQAVTDDPWKGLKLRDDNWLAENEAALRYAAVSSRDSAEGIALMATARWARDTAE